MIKRRLSESRWKWTAPFKKKKKKHDVKYLCCRNSWEGVVVDSFWSRTKKQTTSFHPCIQLSLFLSFFLIYPSAPTNTGTICPFRLSQRGGGQGALQTRQRHHSQETRGDPHRDFLTITGPVFARHLMIMWASRVPLLLPPGEATAGGLHGIYLSRQETKP